MAGGFIDLAALGTLSFDAFDRCDEDHHAMLRNVMESDLPIFFEHQCDAEAASMAAPIPIQRHG
jgi:hypothetical protein